MQAIIIVLLLLSLNNNNSIKKKNNSIINFANGFITNQNNNRIIGTTTVLKKSFIKKSTTSSITKPLNDNDKLHNVLLLMSSSTSSSSSPSTYISSTKISKSLAIKLNNLKDKEFMNNHKTITDQQSYFNSLIEQSIAENIPWDEYISLLNDIIITNNDNNNSNVNLLLYRCTLQACVNAGHTMKAYELLSSNKIKSDTIQPTIEMYNIVIISLCKDRKIWKNSILLLDQMMISTNNRNNEYDNYDKSLLLKIYNTIISTCSKNKEGKIALELLKSIKDSKIIKPDIVSYNSVMNACVKTPPNYYKDALQLFDNDILQTEDDNVIPDIITYTCAIRACTKGKLIKRSLSLFDKAKEIYGDKLDVHIYTAIIDACSKGGKYYSRKAIDLFTEMRKEYNIKPNFITYSCLINACGNSYQWELALDYFHEMKQQKRYMRLDVIVYNNVISSLAKTAKHAILNINTKPRFYIPPVKHQEYINQQEQLIKVLCDKALYLLNDMKKNRIQPDIVTYNSIITTLSYDPNRWKESLDLLNTIIQYNNKNSNSNRKRNPIKINKILYTSVMTACGRAGKYEYAQGIFNQMKKHGKHLQPDRITYNSLLSSLRISNQTNLVYNLWEEMCNSNTIKPDIITITDVLTSLHQNDTLNIQDKYYKMDYVFEDAVKRGILLKGLLELDDNNSGDNSTSLDTFYDYDLSGMSFSVANTCIRYLVYKRILVSYNKDNNSLNNDLQFITGVGYNNYHYYNTQQQPTTNNNEKDDDGDDDITSSSGSTSTSATTTTNRMNYEKNYHPQGLKEYVQEILRNDYNPPLYSIVPDRAKGTVVIKKDVLRRWIDAQQ